ncbi:hypothetical protein QF028_000143 [Neobacillus sp. B4I6]
MKIVYIFFLYLLLTITFNFVINLLMGINFSNAIRNLKNPFWVMTFPEYLIIFSLLSTMIILPIVSFFKNRKKTRNV